MECLHKRHPPDPSRSIIDCFIFISLQGQSPSVGFTSTLIEGVSGYFDHLVSPKLKTFISNGLLSGK